MKTLHRVSGDRRLPVVFAWVWILTVSTAGATEPSDPTLAQQAENGDAGAMLDYARHLISTESPDALAWLRKAAASFDQEKNWFGLMEACLDLAEFSPDKEEAGKARDQVTAMIERAADANPEEPNTSFAALRPLLERAYASKVPAAAALIGWNLRKAGDAKQAFEWYSKAATKGYPPAMVQVGLMYSNGDGVETNMEKAASWLRPANMKKSASGKHLLAECFLYGKGVPTNPELAARLLQEAITLQASGRSFDLLGTCYHKGWGVEPDPRKAAQFYQQACESKYYNAYANLAVLYMTGAGVAQDESIAVDLLQQGVEKGNNPLCMYFLGLAQWEGKGIRKSKRKARKWMISAAEAGNEQAATWCQTNHVEFSAP